jgi:hypothetical protein
MMTERPCPSVAAPSATAHGPNARDAMPEPASTPRAKCAHPSCDCDAPAGAKYCSDYCKKAPETELHCNCMHPGCRA